MNPLEIAANIFNIGSVWLANRNHSYTWVVGIVACVLLGVLFFQSRLYADVTLQIFFIVTSLIGLLNWQSTKNKVQLPITRIEIKKTIGFGLLAALVSLAYGWMLQQYTNASYPFVDSLVLGFSVLAQFLLMERKLENWIFWIIVDIISVPLFWSKGLYITAAIYLLFLVNAIWGLLHWIKLYKTQSHQASN